MSSLQWVASHAVFVTEIDDQHQGIFDALTDLRCVLESEPAPLLPAVQRLMSRLLGHFAHEERLMRAARYESLRWHKRLHDNARRRAVIAAAAIEQGDRQAGLAFVESLSRWLHDHTRLADAMMAAFLRNHRRGMYRLEIQVGTKPLDSCDWVNVDGEKFAPAVIRTNTRG